MSKRSSRKKFLQDLDKSQEQLWRLGEELHSYASLLKGLDLEQIQGGRLYGLGLCLERISTKVEKISDQLGLGALEMGK
ncbi:MAG: hypothetical protein KDK66_05935 [Deltaproteobacteria bacterium]|nr:hypothetical protein [Deltaproteobacteria bacterium]